MGSVTDTRRTRPGDVATASKRTIEHVTAAIVTSEQQLPNFSSPLSTYIRFFDAYILDEYFWALPIRSDKLQ